MRDTYIQAFTLRLRRKSKCRGLRLKSRRRGMELLQKMSVHFNLPNAFTRVSAFPGRSVRCVLRFFIAYIVLCRKVKLLFQVHYILFNIT